MIFSHQKKMYLLEMEDLMFKSFDNVLITIALVSNSFGVDILKYFSEDRFLNSPGGYVKVSRFPFHDGGSIFRPDTHRWLCNLTFIFISMKFLNFDITDAA